MTNLTLTNVTRDSGVSDPDGGTDAHTLTATADGGVARVIVGLSGVFADGGEQTDAFYIRRRTGSGAIYLYNITNLGYTEVTVTDEWTVVTSSGVQTGNRYNGIRFARSGDAVDVFGRSNYRSDLGGMVDNPDRGDYYVPTTSAAVYMPRRGHHIWNGSAWINAGLRHESEARTNLLHTTDALVTQSHTVTAVPHTLHFTGTGTVTLSGASTAGPLVGTGTGEDNRVSLTFTPSAASLTLTVSGTVSNAQLEIGSTPSSYIPNLAGSGTVTRAAETLTIAAANLQYSATAMSIQTQGRMTYADTSSVLQAYYIRWYASSADNIEWRLNTGGVKSGNPYFVQEIGSVSDSVGFDVGDDYSAGALVPFNLAARHGSTFINGAVDGAAYTANETPVALPDLSGTDFELGYDFMGTIGKFRMWDADLADAGIEEAST